MSPARLALLAVLGLGCLVACFGSDSRSLDVPRQGWWQERGPVVPHESFPADCSSCHYATGWDEIRDDFSFDHEQQTGLALYGAHAVAECLRCHNDRGPAVLFAGKGCAGCHEDPHLRKLGVDCAQCHSENDWQPVGQIAAHNETRFPLVGAHAATACFACHEGAQVGNFQRTDIECVSCHRTDLLAAKDPDHVAQGWTMDCERCHIPIAWQGAGFTHTVFPLTGGHALGDCTACHVDGSFAGTPNDCASCHQDDWAATTNPNHLMAGFSLECQECHNTLAWPGAVFDHGVFPLVGGHAALACATCHPTGLYAGTPTDCASCHIDDYNNTTNPNHIASGFGTSCELCHNVNAWEGAVFNHTFPINNGTHSNLDCLDCHAVPGNPSVFSCVDCHAHEPNQTNADHSEVNGYVYASASCLACHPSGN